MKAWGTSEMISNTSTLCPMNQVLQESSLESMLLSRMLGKLFLSFFIFSAENSCPHPRPEESSHFLLGGDTSSSPFYFDHRAHVGKRRATQIRKIFPSFSPIFAQHSDSVYILQRCHQTTPSSFMPNVGRNFPLIKLILVSLIYVIFIP